METTYQQQALRGASSIELVLALYDGAIRFLYRAIQCVDEQDQLGRRVAVNRVIEIVMYLQARLRTDIGGRPAASLSDFYAAMFTMTLEASHHASREQFEEVIACFRNVREAWQVVARDPEAQKLLPRELRTHAERYARALPATVSTAPAPTAEPITRWSA